LQKDFGEIDQYLTELHSLFRREVLFLDKLLKTLARLFAKMFKIITKIKDTWQHHRHPSITEKIFTRMAFL
jgi:hypothetical protein